MLFCLDRLGGVIVSLMLHVLWVAKVLLCLSSCFFFVTGAGGHKRVLWGEK